jgi:hypothetical protein
MRDFWWITQWQDINDMYSIKNKGWKQNGAG